MKVLDASGNSVEGEIKITEDETAISFMPLDAWQEGSYYLLCEARLEDLAGNNLNRLFDEDFTVKKNGTVQESYNIPFSIR